MNIVVVGRDVNNSQIKERFAPGDKCLILHPFVNLCVLCALVVQKRAAKKKIINGGGLSLPLKLKSALFKIESVFVLLSVICCSLCSCKNYNRNKSHDYIPVSSIKKGDELAHIYCQSCHAFAEPSLLNAESWENGVLPQMGPRLGIFEHLYRRYPSIRNDRNLDSNFYPSAPVITPQQWQNIIDYYTATAPDSLTAKDKESVIKTGLPLFRVQLPAASVAVTSPTYLKIVSSANEHSVLLADLETQNLFKFNSNLQIIDSLSSAGTIADIDFRGDTMMLCDMGPINPNNGKFGKGHYTFKSVNGKMNNDTTPVLNQLARPVQIISADIDKDGRTDYVACEFGYSTGAFSWFRNLGNNTFQKSVLKPIPGAIKVVADDYNKDGLPDLWVLFAQGEEGIFLFTNKGAGKFDQREVLRFPPVYGSTYFELADFNKDGYQDIVYTCGDNADYSPVLKPYHGVYIFINDGKNNFKQQYFFHINGCFKAIARDYDNDGDTDIAAIAFFADYVHRPDESFVYLENKGSYSFTPSTFSEAQQGRWLTMDAGDIDGDGRIDLVLGNFSVRPTSMQHKYDWKKGPPFVLLKNVGKGSLGD